MNIKASILVLSLWAVCLLSVFAVILGYSIRQEVTLVSRLDEREKLSLCAEAGVKRALLEINKMEAKAFDALNEAWANNPDIFRDVSLGDSKFNVGYKIEGSADNPGFRWGLMDEERKININKTELGVLTSLIQLILNVEETAAQELAASIIDWRDNDSALLIPLGSAEDSFYRSLTEPYEAKDADFEVVDEAMLVKGMTKDNFLKLADYITIYGEGKININTASKLVLMSLGLKENIADKLLSFRRGEDGLEGTQDDGFFSDIQEVAQKLNAGYPLNTQESLQLTGVSERYLSVSSSFFMIKSAAVLNNNRGKKEITCITDKTGSILYWNES